MGYGPDPEPSSRAHTPSLRAGCRLLFRAELFCRVETEAYSGEGQTLLLPSRPMDGLRTLAMSAANFVRYR